MNTIKNVILSDRLGSWFGVAFFSFWIGQRFYFNYYPSLLWWLITFQFTLFVLAYLTRRPAEIHARGFMEIVFPFICAGLPFALDNYPFKPPGVNLYKLAPLYMTLMFAGVIFIIGGVIFLRRSFSIMAEVRQPVFSGLYRITRHPMYLGSILSALGLLLFYYSLINVAIFLIFCACQLYRAGLEEKKIMAAFPEYRAYAAKVGWFWKLGRRK